jgi:hypothetical protein
MRVLTEFLDGPYNNTAGCLALSSDYSGYGVEPQVAHNFVLNLRPSELTVDRISTDFPKACPAILSFLSPRAYTYFFPSFLTIALENVDNDLDEFGIGAYTYDSVVYFMHSMAIGKCQHRLEQLLIAYSKKQLQVLACALVEMRKLRIWPILGEDEIEVALDRYWGQYIT